MDSQKEDEKFSLQLWKKEIEDKSINFVHQIIRQCSSQIYDNKYSNKIFKQYLELNNQNSYSNSSPKIHHTSKDDFISLIASDMTEYFFSRKPERSLELKKLYVDKEYSKLCILLTKGFERFLRDKIRTLDKNKNYYQRCREVISEFNQVSYISTGDFGLYARKTASDIQHAPQNLLTKTELKSIPAPITTGKEVDTRKAKFIEQSSLFFWDKVKEIRGAFFIPISLFAQYIEAHHDTCNSLQYSQNEYNLEKYETTYENEIDPKDAVNHILERFNADDKRVINLLINCDTLEEVKKKSGYTHNQITKLLERIKSTSTFRD